MTTEQHPEPQKPISWTGIIIGVGLLGGGLALAFSGAVPAGIVGPVLRILGMIAKLL